MSRMNGNQEGPDVAWKMTMTMMEPGLNCRAGQFKSHTVTTEVPTKSSSFGLGFNIADFAFNGNSLPKSIAVRANEDDGPFTQDDDICNLKITVPF